MAAIIAYEGGSGYTWVESTRWCMQSFTIPSTFVPDKIQLYIGHYGNGAGNPVARLYKTTDGYPAGAVLTAETLNPPSGGGGWTDWDISEVGELTEGDQYCIVLNYVTGDSGDLIRWYVSSVDNVDIRALSINSGGTWMLSSGPEVRIRVYEYIPIHLINASDPISVGESVSVELKALYHVYEHDHIDVDDYRAVTKHGGHYDVYEHDHIDIAETIANYFPLLRAQVVDSITITEMAANHFPLLAQFIVEPVSIVEAIEAYPMILDIAVTDTIAVVEDIYALQNYRDGYTDFKYSRNLHENSMLGQTFSATGTYEVSHIRCVFARNGTLDHDVQLQLYNLDEDGFPTGSPMCYIEFDPSSYSTSLTWHEYAVTNYLVLESGKSYAVVLTYNYGDEDNCLRWASNPDTPTYYSSGCSLKNSGANWYTLVPLDESEDFGFIIRGPLINSDYKLRDDHTKYCMELDLEVNDNRFVMQQVNPTDTYILKYVDLALFSNYEISRQNVQMYIVKLLASGLPQEAETREEMPGKILASSTQPAYKIWRKLNDIIPWTHFELDAPVVLYAGSSYGIVVKLSGGSVYPIYWGANDPADQVGHGSTYNGQISEKAANTTIWNALTDHNTGFKLFGSLMNRTYVGDSISVEENVSVAIEGVSAADMFINVSDEIDVHENDASHVSRIHLVNQGAESYTSQYNFYEQSWPGCLFAAVGDYWVTRIGMRLGKSGSPVNIGWIGIRSTDEDNLPDPGEGLGFTTFDTSTLQNTPRMEYFDVPPIHLNSGEMYAITVACPYSDSSNYIKAMYLNNAVKGDAHWCTTANWGATWTMAPDDQNMVFELYGYTEKGAGELDLEMVKDIDGYTTSPTYQQLRGQNFTPNVSGWLTAIDVPLYRDAPATGNFQFEVYPCDGSREPLYWGNQPGLGQEQEMDVTILKTVDSDPMGWYHHVFDPPIYLSNSAHYAFVINRTSVGTGSITLGGCNSSPTYPGHEIVYSQDYGETWGTVSGTDRGFRTYMIHEEDIPEVLSIDVSDSIMIAETVNGGRGVELQSNMEVGYTQDVPIYNLDMVGQVFYPETDYLFTDFSMYCKRVGSAGAIYVEVYRLTNEMKPLGDFNQNYFTQLSESTSGWSTSLAWHKLTFSSPVVLHAGEAYVFIVKCPDGADVSNCIKWGIDGSDTDNDDAMILTDDGGQTWTTESAYSPYYRIQGSPREWDIETKLVTKYETKINTIDDVHINIRKAQTFKVTERTLCDKIAVGLSGDGDTYGYIIAEVFHTDGTSKPWTSGQTPLATGTIETGELPTRTARPVPWTYVKFATPVSLTPNVDYALVLRKMPIGGEV